MSYKDVMNIILPPREGKAAHITGHYGEVRGKGPHGGSDFNYVGGQSGINLQHPTLRSPVDGKVVFVGGQYGTIKIRDQSGNTHEILHTQKQSVKVDQVVTAGTAIGTMGGRGPRGADQYQQHVHYQLKDADGRLLNPEVFWGQQQPGITRRDPLEEGVKGPQVMQAHALYGGSSPGQPSAEVLPAAADGVLREGTEGTGIARLQQTLDRLGYRDAQGHPLKRDGDFGLHTKEALQAFQRDHGLPGLGIAGPKTQAALHAADQQLLTHPQHPHHGRYQTTLEKVHVAEAQRHIAAGPHSERLAAALAVEAIREGITRIDRVELNDPGTLARAVQVSALRDESALNRTTDAISTRQATGQSILESSEQAQQVANNVQAQQAELQRTQDRGARAL